MSSPPPSAGSPTSANGFSLPRKRGPSVQIPTQNKRRKPSSVTSASHPLRQTSFPPPENGIADGDGSPSAQRASFSPSVSSVGGRGRGRKRRPGVTRSTTAAGTAKDGDERSVGPNSSQAADGPGREEEEGDEDEDEGMGADDTMLEGGALMSDAAKKQDQEYQAMLQDAFTPDQNERYIAWRRVKLKPSTLRRLVNQTLSQSVQPNIITAINGFTKVFISELVERARDVQAEWLIAEKTSKDSKPSESSSSRPASQRSDGVSNGVNGAAAKQSESQPTSPAGITSPSGQGASLQNPAQDSQSLDATQDAGHQESQERSEKKGVLDVDEPSRGPLTPDHLREALRRYKKDREGGSAGFQGMSMLGREMTASRSGGKRLFR
ncbi:MAG: hypothetical protein Q9162_007601 [Coniocarpon cinnabarinum]